MSNNTVNKVILVGHLGKDPERKVTQAGKEFSRFTMATTSGWKEKEVAMWHNVSVFSENDAKFINQYATTGTLLYIEGEIEYRQYDKDGVTMYATSIVVPQWGGTVRIMKDGKGRGGETARARGGPAGYAEQSGGRTAPRPNDFHDDLDDEIPF